MIYCFPNTYAQHFARTHFKWSNNNSLWPLNKNLYLPLILILISKWILNEKGSYHYLKWTLRLIFTSIKEISFPLFCWFVSLSWKQKVQYRNYSKSHYKYMLVYKYTPLPNIGYTLYIFYPTKSDNIMINVNVNVRVKLW